MNHLTKIVHWPHYDMQILSSRFWEKKMDKSKEVRTLGPRCLYTTTQFPQITLIAQIPQNRYNSTRRWLLHLSKTIQDAKLRVEDCGLLYVYPCSWFWLFESSIPKLLWCPKYANTGISQPSDVLKPHWMWNLELKT